MSGDWILTNYADDAAGWTTFFEDDYPELNDAKDISFQGFPSFHTYFLLL